MTKQVKNIFLGCLSFIIAITVFCGCKAKNIEEQKPENVEEKQELVYTTEDGTKVNKSDKIVNETKKLGNLEFKNILITESGERTKLEFDVYNSSSERLEEKNIQIILLNTKNEEIKKIKPVYIGTIPPKETVKGHAETTLDYAEVYDVKFVENK